MNPKLPILFFAVLAVLAALLSPSALRSQDAYQTGKYVDLNSDEYDKLISNPNTGAPVTVRRRENFLSVQVGDIVIVGECVTKENMLGRIHNPCQPGNWIIGDPIEVRLKGHLMFLKSPNGKEVKTRIVKRVRVEADAKK
ncbi:MAG TPA: hypothetical protein VG860_06650 [Terriglobia bacterium]|nr:hypothetical protein [Terriglobia bacterium]